MRFGRVVSVAALAVGCAQAHGIKDEFESEAVSARVNSALEARGVTSVSGIYENCLLRSGSWSVGLGETSAESLPHPKLEVLADEPTCKLWLTDLAAKEHFTATPPLDLNAAAGVTTFVAESGATITVTAVRDPSSKDGLVISLIETASQSATSQGSSAIFASVKSSFIDTTVQPSDYTFTFGLDEPLTVAVDAHQVVVSATGSATLVDGARPGDSFVVSMETFPEPVNVSAVATAFSGGTALPLKAGLNELPANLFRLEKANLSAPVARTVIVSRSQNGVAAYQLIRITFGEH